MSTLRRAGLASLAGPLAMLVLTACSTPQRQEPFDLVQARREIDAANQQFVDLLARGDTDGIAEFFTVDAKSMGPNEPAHEGRDRIRSVYQALISAGLTRMTLTTTGVWGTEELLAEEGRYTFSDTNGKEADRGKYVVLWKKQDGRWKLFRDVFNSDLPAVPQASP